MSLNEQLLPRQAGLCHQAVDLVGAQRVGDLEAALADPAVDLVALEKGKIKGAVRTDFILSAEIIAITLGAVAGGKKQIAELAERGKDVASKSRSKAAHSTEDARKAAMKTREAAVHQVDQVHWC